MDALITRSQTRVLQILNEVLDIALQVRTFKQLLNRNIGISPSQLKAATQKAKVLYDHLLTQDSSQMSWSLDISGLSYNRYILQLIASHLTALRNYADTLAVEAS